VDTTRIVTNAYGTTDIWRATDLEFLDFWERATALGRLHQAWQAIRARDAALPATGEFTPPTFDPQVFAAVLPAGAPATAGCDPHCLPQLFYADTPPEAPMAVRITVPGTSVQQAPLDGLFSPILQDALISDLLLCRGTREPMYQQIYQKVSAIERCYVRLLLPTADADNRVQRIFGVCRPLYAEQELMHWSAD
jgi:hypothetical protein